MGTPLQVASSPPSLSVKISSRTGAIIAGRLSSSVVRKEEEWTAVKTSSQKEREMPKSLAIHQSGMRLRGLAGETA